MLRNGKHLLLDLLRRERELRQPGATLPAHGSYSFAGKLHLYPAVQCDDGTAQYADLSCGRLWAVAELQYGYQNGILQSITDVRDSPNVTIWQANAVDAAGQITQDTLGNGLVTNRAYDSVTQWLSSVESGPGGGASIQNLSFLYDEVGNVTQRQDGIHNLSENIYYDNDYRLSYSTLGGTQNLSMTYDPMGNITNKSTVSNNATWTYDSVHLHQVREAGSAAYEYTYDANGNMTSWAGEPITWTSYNYPRQITDTSDTFTFSYAPDRSIWLEVQNGGLGSTTYRLGSPLMSIVVDSSGTTDRNYIYAGNEPVAIDERTSASNTFYYLLTDHQGSISGITNSSGQVVLNESFHPDGQRRNPSTWTDPIAGSDVTTIQGISPRGYTFKETLEYMNLIDFGGRVGDVFTGRFLSADPNIPDPTDPQSYNRYSYTVNNPLTYTDPTGFFTKKDPDGASEGGITQSLPPVRIWGNQNTYCADIFCVANVYGGTGVLEGNLANPQWHFGPDAPPSSGVTQTPGPQQSDPPTVPNLPQVVITPRAPDFVHISYSFPIENEFTGPYGGIGFTVTIDRYGHVYLSVNGVGGVPTAKGASVMVGWMNSSTTPSSSQLSGMLSSWGGGLQGGYGGGGVSFYGNSSGTAESVGGSTTGASVYGGYTWELPSWLTPSTHW